MEESKENIIWLILILLLLGLTLKIYFDAKIFSCDKCTIEYKNRLVGQDNVADQDLSSTGPIKASLLFDNYIQGRCIVKWDKNLGYILVQDLIEA